jgi:hypothetical protein
MFPSKEGSLPSSVTPDAIGDPIWIVAEQRCVGPALA